MKIINLLPKPKQQELRYEAVFHSLLSVLWLSLFSFALVFVVQLATKFYLEHRAATISDQIANLKQQVNKQDNTLVKNKINQINDVVLDFKTLADSSPKWSKLLKAFTPLPPDGIHITSFTVDQKTKNIVINGYSPTRELVIQLYNNILNDSDQFTNIDYPLENVAKATDISFHFSFYVKDSVLQ